MSVVKSLSIYNQYQSKEQTNLSMQISDIGGRYQILHAMDYFVAPFRRRILISIVH